MQITKTESVFRNSIMKVAAYARVSTSREEQEESYETQLEYYEALIKNNPLWEFAGMYADRGLSGTEVTHRHQFQQMITDAENGKINIILVKSISRFARNAADTQKYLHELKSHNVEVRFDKENLSSLDRNTEMVLNMMAMCAEYESKSISQNTRWALQKQAEKGVRHIGCNQVFGYDEIDGKLVPTRDADTIRMIFESYAAGLSMKEISNKLCDLGIKTFHGNDRFDVGSLSYILSNEIYVGDRLIQKQASKDIFTKKAIPTQDYKSIYIKNHHEGIISREVWNSVQTIRASKSSHKTFGSFFLKGRVFCGDCGAKMSRISYMKSGKRQKVWKCSERMKSFKGNGCKNDIITETELAEILCGYLGIEYSGLENLYEADFENIRIIRVFKDGKIEIK